MATTRLLRKGFPKYRSKLSFAQLQFNHAPDHQRSCTARARYILASLVRVLRPLGTVKDLVYLRYPASLNAQIGNVT
jgi:hypothetical protein